MAEPLNVLHSFLVIMILNLEVAYMHAKMNKVCYLLNIVFLFLVQ